MQIFHKMGWKKGEKNNDHFDKKKGKWRVNDEGKELERELMFSLLQKTRSGDS